MAVQHPLLEVNDLSVSFKMEDECFDAVKNISFTLEKGQTLALVGESGSGKSVSSSSIMGLLPNNARIGEQSAIRFQGQDLLGMDEKAFRNIRGDRIAMIFQEPMTSLNPYMPVGEQVAEAIIHHRGVSKREAWNKRWLYLKKYTSQSRVKGLTIILMNFLAVSCNAL